MLPMGEAVVKKIVVEVEIPEEVEELGVKLEEKLARAAVKILLADLLAAETGLTKEEALWLEEAVKKSLAERRS